MPTKKIRFTRKVPTQSTAPDMPLPQCNDRYGFELEAPFMKLAIKNVKRDCASVIEAGNALLGKLDDKIHEGESDSVELAALLAEYKLRINELLFNADSVNLMHLNDPEITKVIAEEDVKSSAEDEQNLSCSLEIDNGIVYARTPNLYSRYSSTYKTATSRSLISHCRKELERQNHTLVENQAIVGPPLYLLGAGVVVGGFLFGLSLFYDRVDLVAGPRNPFTIPDANNVDTKSVIDGLVGFWSGGDGASCSFSESTIITDELPPGTYFTITKGTRSQPDRVAQLSKLKQLFPYAKPFEPASITL